MIILSVGMPRAGSGWYYNLTNDLMLSTGAQDARVIRQRYYLQSILTEVNCNIGALTPRRLLAVLLPSLLGNTFAIKAHAGPTRFARFLIDRGLMRVTYIYRDPRDALLSALENGKRARQQNRINAFSPLTDLDAAIAFFMKYLKIWEAWHSTDHVLQTRYEELLTQYKTQVDALVNFLGLTPEKPAIQSVIERYQPAGELHDQKGSHFRHGKIGRYRREFSSMELEKLQRSFDVYLERMGYNPPGSAE